MKVEMDIIISSIKLGIKSGSNPKEDRHQYLNIDEISTTIHNGAIVIYPKKWHIKEYKVFYCDECLKVGKKNDDPCYHSSTEVLCREHYEEKVKREDPDKICPVCKEGIITFGTSDCYCSKCNYREPHIHSQPKPKFSSFVMSDKPLISIGYMSSEPYSYFACTCGGWDSPEEHKKRREALKK